MSRRRYVDPAGGRETVGRGYWDGAGASRGVRGGMRCGAAGAADRASSLAAAAPISPGSIPGRCEATPRQGSSLRPRCGAAPGGAALPRCRGARTRPVDLVVMQSMAVCIRRAGVQSRPARPTQKKGGWVASLASGWRRARRPGCRRQTGAGRLRQRKESLLSEGCLIVRPGRASGRCDGPVSLWGNPHRKSLSIPISLTPRKKCVQCLRMG